jgi:hypothetical protein
MRHPAPPSLLRRSALGVAAALGLATGAMAQSDSTVSPLRPSFSLGTGMLGFYGDIGRQSKDYSPLVSRIGYELRASSPVTDWLEVSLFAIHGRLSANEQGLSRNLNFESRITTGGLQFSYNFKQLLRPHHVVEPWVSVGFESLEFLSKTDLLDAQGRRYHYWSDGSIRDLPEDAPNAASAVMLHRDYTYESDVRESNLDGFGKYQEQTWAIPVGVGVKMLLGHGFDARVGATMHFTRTDFIDGISAASLGDRKGDSPNDRFLFTSFSVGYAINMEPRAKKWKNPLSNEQIDVIALNDDEDGDGVKDWSDHCPHTPAGTAVDANGCPLDSDGDGVPDYMDDEAGTPPGTPVNARGVTITDDELLRAWLNFKDSANVNIVSSRVESFGPVGKPKVTRAATPEKRAYVLKVGSQSEGISDEMIQRILSLPDVRTMERGDTTFYIVGNYDALPDAIKRKLQLKGQGFESTVMMEQNGALMDLPAEALSPSEKEVISELAPIAPTDSGEVVVRVQLGAFRHRLATNIFTGVPDLVTIKDKDGLTRYYTGSFTDVNEAAKHKVNMLLKGFEGAFLVAFKDGKRVSITEAGAQLTGPENLNNIPTGSINTDNLFFRVQVGTFVGNVPMETMGKYVDLGNVKPVAGQNAVRYLYGEYPSRAAAEEARKELQNLGFNDAFVVGEINGRIIQAEDAEKLLKDQ